MTSIFESSGRVPELNVLPVRLTVARETAGLSQGQLAETIDASRGTVSNYERGTVTPRRVTLRLWAMATGVDAHWLMTGEAEAPPTPTPPDSPSDVEDVDILRYIACAA